MEEHKEKLLRRFWAKVQKTDSCWLWIPLPTSSGYGQFWYEGRVVSAHVASYLLFVGPITEDKPCVLHTCDNRLCVNPNHLWVGTVHDNNLDRAHKGRSHGGRPKGVNLTLSKAEVEWVKAQRAEGKSYRAIAKLHGQSSRNTVYYAANNIGAYEKVL